MQDITRKAVRPSDSEEHVKFRSIQADEYNPKNIQWDKISNPSIPADTITAITKQAANSTLNIAI
jgi:hypothetical protein